MYWCLKAESERRNATVCFALGSMKKSVNCFIYAILEGVSENNWLLIHEARFFLLQQRHLDKASNQEKKDF